MPKVGRQGPDPHLKSPFLKYVLIIGIILLLVIFVVPKAIEIYNNNVDETSERADNS